MKTLIIVIFILWAVFAGIGLSLMAGTDYDDWEDDPEDMEHENE